MNDHSLATTLVSFRKEMTSVVTTMMAVNEKEQAKERQEYKKRRKVEDQQRTEAEEHQEAQRKDAGENERKSNEVTSNNWKIRRKKTDRSTKA